MQLSYSDPATHDMPETAWPGVVMCSVDDYLPPRRLVAISAREDNTGSLDSDVEKIIGEAVHYAGFYLHTASSTFSAA